MNEWFKKVIGQIKTLWGKWKAVQKIIFFSVIGVAIVAIILLFNFNSSPGMVDLFASPVIDEKERQDIVFRLEQENVEVRVTAENIIQVKDKSTAKRMKDLLTREDKIPSNIEPYDFFNDMSPFTITEWHNNVKLQQAMQKELELFIESMPEISNADIILKIPPEALFIVDEEETSVSVMLTPTPGSNVLENPAKIKGIARLIKLGVTGLKDEFLVITDQHGNIKNDLENWNGLNALKINEEQLKFKLRAEREKRKAIIAHLLKPFKNEDRFSVSSVEIDFDFTKETVTTDQILPTYKIPDNPDTPYDDSESQIEVMISSDSTDIKYNGSYIYPNGPPGSEGQMPDALRDVDAGLGDYDETRSTINYDASRSHSVEEKPNWNIKRVSVSVLIDGKWEKQYDENNELIFENGSIVREYIPPSQEELDAIKSQVEGQVGYIAARGDIVNVAPYQFDRTEEHRAEDEKIMNKKRMENALLYSIIGIVVLVIAFVVFRLVSREMERRRRLREEELSRQHQAMREAALRSAEEEGVDVQMSVEERARMEMQENAINMAREHPEDVAQLIRTWLIEE